MGTFTFGDIAGIGIDSVGGGKYDFSIDGGMQGLPTVGGK